LENFYFFMVKLLVLTKPLPFDKIYIYSWINLKTILLTKSFSKIFWLLCLTLLSYSHNYIIDLTCFLFVYIFTYLGNDLAIYLPLNLIIPIYLPTHTLIHLPTHLTTYHLHDANVCQCMIYNIWKYYIKRTNNHFNHIWAQCW